MLRLLICAILLFIGLGSLKAQDSLQVQPIPSAPGNDESPSPEKQEKTKEDRIAVRQNDLPAPMKDALMNDDKYIGWENSAIYFERNSEQYLVHIQKENATQTYRFDKTGIPITTTAPQTEGTKQ